MGANSSTTTTIQNPSDQSPPSSTSSTMPSISPDSQNPDPKTLEIENPDPKTLENQTPEISDQPTNPDEKGPNQTSQEGEEDEEEEGECGFCLFMKGGGCKDAFIAWENCVEEGEKNKEDIVDKCHEVTGNLKKCMEANSEYYEPILRAEKAADDEVKEELEREKAKISEANDGDKAIEESATISVDNRG